MIRMSDLAQLLALAALREERARAAVSTAGGALADQQDALAGVDAAIDRHDAELDERDGTFLQSIRSRPFSANELARICGDKLNSDQSRASLVKKRNEADQVKQEREERLAEARLIWRQRLVQRDKLAEIQQHLDIGCGNRAAVASDLEAEEASADRVQPSW